MKKSKARELKEAQAMLFSLAKEFKNPLLCVLPIKRDGGVYIANRGKKKNIYTMIEAVFQAIVEADPEGKGILHFIDEFKAAIEEREMCGCDC